MTQKEAKIILRCRGNGYSEDEFNEALEIAYSTLDSSLPSNLDEAAEKYAKGEGLENALGGWEDMSDAFKADAEWMAGQGITVECGVRVYPTLDEEPHPWVSLYRYGIDCNSIVDIPELETLDFKDGDNAIVTIRKK